MSILSISQCHVHRYLQKALNPAFIFLPIRTVRMASNDQQVVTTTPQQIEEAVQWRLQQVTEQTVQDEVDRRLHLKNPEIELHIAQEVARRVQVEQSTAQPSTLLMDPEEWQEVQPSWDVPVSPPRLALSDVPHPNPTAIPLVLGPGPPPRATQPLLRPAMPEQLLMANAAPPPGLQAFYLDPPDLTTPFPQADPTAYTVQFAVPRTQAHEIVLPPGVANVGQWGQAVVQSGKYKGKQYQDVVLDAQYLRWLLPRKHSNNPHLLNLAQYVKAYQAVTAAQPPQ